MIDYFNKPQPAIVDAIEEGRIVKVPEDYARREGLLILRKTPQIDTKQTPVQKKDEDTRKNKGFIGMEDLRKPLSTKNNELLNELVENFHWIIVQKRKVRGLTRKKVAEEVGDSELNVKMLENGVLPANNFVLVNKLESYYGINLRKTKVPSIPAGRPLRQPIDFASRVAARRGEKRIDGVKEKDVMDIIDSAGAGGKSGEKKEEKEVLDLSNDGDVDISKF